VSNHLRTFYISPLNGKRRKTQRNTIVLVGIIHILDDFVLSERAFILNTHTYMHTQHTHTHTHTHTHVNLSNTYTQYRLQRSPKNLGIHSKNPNFCRNVRERMLRSNNTEIEREIEREI